MSRITGRWEKNNEQLIIEEALLPQPAQPEPQEEAIDNEVNEVVVPPIHLLNEENQFMHLEILENALMNDDEIQEFQNELNMDWQQEQPAQDNNIQLGMVRIIDRFYPSSPDTDFSKLGFQNRQSLLQPTLDSSKAVINDSNVQVEKGKETTMIEVPKKWAEFFKVFLNSADSYTWARD